MLSTLFSTKIGYDINHSSKVKSISCHSGAYLT
jgi:hypothetical protein